MNKNAQKGFTLYELLITVVVAGIIIAYGIPNLRQFQLNNRMVAATNDLLAVFSMARTEAIKRKTNVSVCASDNWNDATPVCGAVNGDVIAWHEGWVAFVDFDGDLVLDAGDGDVLLRVGGPPPGNDADPDDAGNIKMSTTNDSEFFAFRATGFGRGDLLGQDSLMSVYIYDSRGNEGQNGGTSAARMLVVSAAGRAQMYRDPEFIRQVCLDAAFSMTCTGV
ncbi:MAG: GspH/FimT family pseudopilin [Pseudomonadota bacterium]